MRRDERTLRTCAMAAVSLAVALSTACAHARRPLIGLFTDYGTQDSYVAELKGAIYSTSAHARLVDLTHQVPAFNIREGAFLLRRAVRGFPAGTVFVAVVDPGVGTSRKPVAARTATGKILIGPDNGLFTYVCDAEGPCETHELLDKRYWRDANVSTTFHGRDIFGPVAAHVADGVPLAALGPLVPTPERFTVFPPQQNGDEIVGEIVHVDVYGNVTTNVPASMLQPGALYQLGGYKFPLKSTYGDVGSGEPVMVIDSEGHAELALSSASLAAATGWRAASRIHLYRQP